MQLVKLENKEILLNSRLTELAFGKTSFSSIISQKGLLAECDACQEGKYHFTFKDWTFEEVKALDVEDRDDRLVFFSGNGKGFSKNASTFDQIINDKDEAKAFEAGFILCTLLTQAACENIKVPMIGGGGIFMEVNKAKTKVLFLPEDLFKPAAAGLSNSEYSELQGHWVNPTLFGLPALCFMRGTIAYRMLTGRFAYPSTDQVERNADIMDRKFLPLELSVNGVDKTLAKEINKALKLNSNIVSIPGKKQKGKASEDLTPTASFPLELLYAAKNNSAETKLTDEELQAKAQAYLKTQASKVNTKRKLRRNASGIIIGLIAAAVIAICTVNLVKVKMDEYYSKGMTSTEMVQTYLWGVNEKDTITLSNIVKGHKVQKVVDTVSNIYVLSKQRQAVNHDNGFGTLTSWLFYTDTADCISKGGLYAVGFPMIDGKPVTLKNQAYKKNEKPEAVTSENGIEIHNEDKSVHKAEYYLLHTEGEYNDIECEKVSQTFTLTYIKDRWYITAIDTIEEHVEFNSTAFKNDWITALARTNGDIITAADQLRLQYIWLPPKAELQKELQRKMAQMINPLADL